MTNPAQRQRAHTYTAWARWGAGRSGPTEEIDVQAHSRAAAQRKAEALLAEGYEPGGRITRITQRPDGFYF